jgi:PAS domain S-box-containing protein
MPKSLFPAADQSVRDRLERDETLKLINNFDWASTPIGPIATWPESVRGALRVMIASKVAMIMMIGEQGVLVYNHPYTLIAGQRHPEILGKPVAEAWPEVAEFNLDIRRKVMAGETVNLEKQELVLNRHGVSEAVWFDLGYSPVLDDSGTPVAVFAVVIETTQRVLAEDALARSEERVSIALNGSGLVGTWDWDVVNQLVTADDRLARLYGIDPQQAGLGVGVEQFLAAIHADDRVRMGVEINEVLQSGNNYRSEYRVAGEDGLVRWIAASGRPRLDNEGRAVRFPGVAVDITEQKAATAALAASEASLRTLADTMPQIVWSARPDGFHDYYNARWYEFTGVPFGSTDGEGWSNMFHPDDQDRAWTVWRMSLATGDPFHIEYRLRHHSGDYRWLLGQALPVKDAEGRILRWFGTLTDIHESKLATEEREAVAQELSHRIKNIFSVISGIISLSARSYPEIKPLAEELRNRIVALGLAHDFVRPHSKASHPQKKQTSLHALVEVLMTPYLRDGEERLVFIGPDAEIDEGAATPLALLFHELATNAAKYGPLVEQKGKITLSSSLDGSNYLMTWKETGGPEISSPQELNGFGSRLISLSVEGQLRGMVNRHWDKDGLRIDLQLPLDTLARPATLKQKASTD